MQEPIAPEEGSVDTKGAEKLIPGCKKCQGTALHVAEKLKTEEAGGFKPRKRSFGW
jgi:hypothetical protein